MVDHIVGASAPRGRVWRFATGSGGGAAGATRTRHALSRIQCAAGAVVSEVARRHEISPQHLFAWRKAARAGQLTLPADGAAMFVPVMLAARKPVAAQPSAPSITIETAGVVVRAECGVDVDWLAAVLRAVKTLS